MCGPSNGAKNLLAHVDRDRTLHQDRLVNGAQAGPGSVSRASHTHPSARSPDLVRSGGHGLLTLLLLFVFQTFRSQGPISHGSDAAFANFQQGIAPMEPAMLPAMDMNAIHHTASVRPVGPAGIAHHGPSTPAARLSQPATGGASHQDWVGQFHNMNLSAPTVAGPSTAMPAPATAAPLAQTMAMPPTMATPFGMPMFSPAPDFAFQQQAPAVQDPIEAALMNDDAFARAFEEYEQVAKEDDELAKALAEEKQKIANAEFIEAQDQWMAEHGPRAEQARSGAKTGPPTADEMEVIDHNLEELAREQEEKRRNDEELARAANEIVASVAGNQSEKFKKSKFFELMRRIAAHEVVVQGDNFVETATGETVNNEYPYEENEPEEYREGTSGANGAARPQA